MRLTSIALVLCLAPACAQAQESAPFYRGKTIRIVISTGVAGGYAEYARVIAEHMGRHIAGNPGFIVQSMPGAGGLQAANYLFAQAPQDGTTIGIVHSSVPLAPLWGSKGVRFDTLKFNWLGSLDRVDGMCISWNASPIKTWADMLSKEMTVGSSGAGSQMETYPAILNKLFGTKIKVVAGYKDGVAVYIAMERGELDGRCGGHLTVIKVDAAALAHRAQDCGADPDRPEAQSGIPRHADRDGARQGRADAPAARSRDADARPRPAGNAAARRAGRAGAGAARGLRHHHGGLCVPRRHRPPEPACRSGPRGGDGKSVRASLCVAARSHCWRT
jgi:hypothetical protein